LFTITLAIAWVVAGMPTSTAVAAMPAATSATPCAAGTPVLGDFDGDGRADLVEGAVKSRQPGDAQVMPGNGAAPYSLSGVNQLAAADLNGDKCSDAVVSDSGRQTGVRLYFGTPDGLSTTTTKELDLPQLAQMDEYPDLTKHVVGLRHDGVSQVVVLGDYGMELDDRAVFMDVFTLDSSGVPGPAQVVSGGLPTDSECGSLSLSSSGRTVVVGDCGAYVSGKEHAGAVYVLSFNSGNQLIFRTRITQNSPGVPGSAEKYDEFGESVSYRDGHLAIGVPGEGIGKVPTVGMVQPILWNEAASTYTALRAIQQNLPGVPGTNEAADLFGESVAVTRGLTASGSYDIAIGAPTEAIGKAKEAGAVTVANFSKAIFRGYSQNTHGMPGGAEADDNFGSSVSVLSRSATVDTLVIGAPGENVTGCLSTGYVAHSDGKRLTSATTWTYIPAPNCKADPIYGWGYWPGQ
jgi:hypothetical protein